MKYGYIELERADGTPCFLQVDEIHGWETVGDGKAAAKSAIVWLPCDRKVIVANSPDEIAEKIAAAMAAADGKDDAAMAAIAEERARIVAAFAKAHSAFINVLANKFVPNTYCPSMLKVASAMHDALVEAIISGPSGKVVKTTEKDD